MIKVCHITTVHLSRYDVRIFEKECTSLSKAGYDVTLLVNDELPDEVKNNVKIISIGIRSRNRLDRIMRVSKTAYMKALNVEADIYHLHDPELLRIGVKLKKKGKKVIFDSHEFTAVQIKYKPYIPGIIRGIISGLYRKYENKCLNKIDGMVQPCTYKGTDFFSSVNIPKIIIGNYPDVDYFKKKRREHADTNKVCYIGGLTEIRGLFHMMKACFLANKKLVLIGRINKELRARMEQMPEFECVEYLGFLPHDSALEEAARCAAGLSLLEPAAQYVNIDNLPTKVYEYMIMGMPVIMSDFPYYGKVLEKYKFGLSVNPYDHRAVAEAILSITDDEAAAVKMGNEGRRAIYEEMNWENDSKRLIKFYEKLVQGDK